MDLVKELHGLAHSHTPVILSENLSAGCSSDLGQDYRIPGLVESEASCVLFCDCFLSCLLCLMPLVLFGSTSVTQFDRETETD